MREYNFASPFPLPKEKIMSVKITKTAIRVKETHQNKRKEEKKGKVTNANHKVYIQGKGKKGKREKGKKKNRKQDNLFKKKNA